MACEVRVRPSVLVAVLPKEAGGRRLFGKTMKRGLIFGIGLLIGFSVIATAEAARVGHVAGDSFSNDSNEWPILITSASMHSTAVGGQTQVQMGVTFETQLNFHISHYDIDFAVIQGGVNDVSSRSVDVAMMRDTVLNMASVAKSAGAPPTHHKYCFVEQRTHAVKARRNRVIQCVAWRNLRKSRPDRYQRRSLTFG